MSSEALKVKCKLYHSVPGQNEWELLGRGDFVVTNISPVTAEFRPYDDGKNATTDVTSVDLSGAVIGSKTPTRVFVGSVQGSAGQEFVDLVLRFKKEKLATHVRQQLETFCGAAGAGAAGAGEAGGIDLASSSPQDGNSAGIDNNNEAASFGADASGVFEAGAAGGDPADFGVDAISMFNDDASGGDSPFNLGEGDADNPFNLAEGFGSRNLDSFNTTGMFGTRSDGNDGTDIFGTSNDANTSIFDETPSAADGFASASTPKAGSEEAANAAEADDVDDSKLKLPDQALEGEAVASGHEEEEELFKCRSRMHRFMVESKYGEVVRRNIWFDCGRGDVHVFKHRHTGAVRLVFRQEITLKVKANFLLKGTLAMQDPSKATRIMVNGAHTMDEEGKVEVANLAFRFKAPESVQALVQLFQQHAGTDTVATNSNASAPADPQPTVAASADTGDSGSSGSTEPVGEEEAPADWATGSGGDGGNVFGSSETQGDNIFGFDPNYAESIFSFGKPGTTEDEEGAEDGADEGAGIFGGAGAGDFSFDPSSNDAGTDMFSVPAVEDASPATGASAVSGDAANAAEADDVDDSKLKLPDQALEGEAVASGHEEEEELFKCRSRMHRFMVESKYGEVVRRNIWFDCGRGDVHVFKHCHTGAVRLVFRQEITLKVKANFLLKGTLAMQDPSKATRIMVNGAHTMDEEGKVEVANLAFRFKAPESVQALVQLFQQHSAIDAGPPAVEDSRHGQQVDQDSAPQTPTAEAEQKEELPADAAADPWGVASGDGNEWTFDGSAIPGAELFGADATNDGNGSAADIFGSTGAGDFSFDPSSNDAGTDMFSVPAVEDASPATGASAVSGDAANAAEADDVDDSKLKLPDQALEGEAVASGHEEEEELFKCRSRMHRFMVESKYGEVVRRNIWFDCGRGDVHVFKHRHTGAVRLVFRQEITLKVKANFLLKGTLAMQDPSKATRIMVNGAHTMDEEGKVEVANLAFRFKAPESVQALVQLFQQHAGTDTLSDVSAEPSVGAQPDTSSVTSSNVDVSESGREQQADSAAEDHNSIFGAASGTEVVGFDPSDAGSIFSFGNLGGGQDEVAGEEGSIFGTGNDMFSQDAAGSLDAFSAPSLELGESAASTDEPDVDTVDDSKLKLPDQALEGEAVASGHEEEEELFKCRSRMHRFMVESKYGEVVRRNIWFDCGRGDVHVFKHRHTGAVRLVFRQEITLKVKANFLLKGTLAMQDPSKATRIMVNGAHTMDEEGKVEVANLAFRFKAPESVQALVQLFQQHAGTDIVATNSNASAPADPQPTVAASADTGDSGSSGSTEPVGEEEAPADWATGSGGDGGNVFGSSETQGDNIFGFDPNYAESIFSFGKPGTTEDEEGAEDGADEGAGIFGGAGAGDFSFDPSSNDAGTDMFSVPAVEDGAGDAANAAEADDVDDSKLKLPDQALEGEAVASGHEEEEELFKCRSRMHRFMVESKYGEVVRRNIWFDCGRGDVHVFKHRHTGAVRLVFRQEITLKVKANFLLKGTLAMQDPSKATRIMVNGAHTMDEEGKVEVANLAFRFKAPESVQALVQLFNIYSGVQDVAASISPTTGTAGGQGDSVSHADGTAPANATLRAAASGGGSAATNASSPAFESAIIGKFRELADGEDCLENAGIQQLSRFIVSKFGETADGQRTCRAVLEQYDDEGQSGLLTLDELREICSTTHFDACSSNNTHSTVEPTLLLSPSPARATVHRFHAVYRSSTGGAHSTTRNYWEPCGRLDVTVAQRPVHNTAYLEACNDDGRPVIRFELLGVVATAVVGKPSTVLVTHAICAAPGAGQLEFQNLAFKFSEPLSAQQLLRACASSSNVKELIFRERARISEIDTSGNWQDLRAGVVSVLRDPASGSARLTVADEATGQATHVQLDAAFTEVVENHPSHFYLNGVNADTGEAMKLHWKFESAATASALDRICAQCRSSDATARTPTKFSVSCWFEAHF